MARRASRVEVADAAASPLRKFLLAGRGGLNLTNAEPLDAFLSRYGDARERLAPAIAALSPDALREWAAGLGEPTFVGSSGRVFPQSFKATRLARAWLRRLGALGVGFLPRRRLMGLVEGGATFAGPEGEDTSRSRRRRTGARRRPRGRDSAATAAGSSRCAARASTSPRSLRPTWGC